MECFLTCHIWRPVLGSIEGILPSPRRKGHTQHPISGQLILRSEPSVVEPRLPMTWQLTLVLLSAKKERKALILFRR